MVDRMGVARASASQLLLIVSSILLVVSVTGDVCGEPFVTATSHPGACVCPRRAVGSTRKRVPRMQSTPGSGSASATLHVHHGRRKRRPCPDAYLRRLALAAPVLPDRRSHRPGTRARVSAPGILDVSHLESNVEGNTLAAWFRADGCACARGFC